MFNKLLIPKEQITFKSQMCGHTHTSDLLSNALNKTIIDVCIYLSSRVILEPNAKSVL